MQELMLETIRNNTIILRIQVNPVKGKILFQPGVSFFFFYSLEKWVGQYILKNRSSSLKRKTHFYFILTQRKQRIVISFPHSSLHTGLLSHIGIIVRVLGHWPSIFVYFAIMILLLSIRPLCVLVVLLWFVSCARLVPMSVSSLTPVSSLSVSVSVCFLFYFDGLLSCVQCVQFCLPRLIMFVHLSYVPMLRWTAFPYSPLCVFVPCIFFTLLDCLSIFLPSFRFSMPLVWCCMPYVPCS